LRNPANLKAYAFITILTLALLLIATTAQAYDCTDTVGGPGWLNGTTNDDAGCITQVEYEDLFSVDGLVASGVFADPVDNGDGTTTIHNTVTGVDVTIVSKALDRPVDANPTPSSPTVAEVLFPFEAGFSLLPS
jgi:hypothetical protein